VMPEHQLIEGDENIAKRYFFDFACFRSGLKVKRLKVCKAPETQW